MPYRGKHRRLVWWRRILGQTRPGPSITQIHQGPAIELTGKYHPVTDMPVIPFDPNPSAVNYLRFGQWITADDVRRARRERVHASQWDFLPHLLAGRTADFTVIDDIEYDDVVYDVWDHANDAPHKHVKYDSPANNASSVPTAAKTGNTPPSDARKLEP